MNQVSRLVATPVLSWIPNLARASPINPSPAEFPGGTLPSCWKRAAQSALLLLELCGSPVGMSPLHFFPDGKICSAFQNRVSPLRTGAQLHLCSFIHFCWNFQWSKHEVIRKYLSPLKDPSMNYSCVPVPCSLLHTAALADEEVSPWPTQMLIQSWISSFISLPGWQPFV